MFYSESEQKWKHYITVNGKRLKTVRADSEEELKKKIKKEEELINKKINFDWKKANVTDLIILFKEENKDNWEKSTYNWYKSILNHIENSIGKNKLWNVTADDLSKMLKSLAVCNPNTDKPASKRMLSCVANVTRQIFKTAYSKRLIEFDPSDNLKVPKQAKTESTRQGTRVLTKEEIGWIIYTPHELQTANLIMLYTGMRSEELLALRWNDINIKEGTININKALKFNNNKPYLGTTKTGKDRIVIMPPDLLEHMKKVYPKKSERDKLVVANSRGEYFSKSRWRSKYESYIKDLDILYGGKFTSKCNPHYKQTIRGWTPYSLRHTSSTYGAAFGVDKKQLADNQGHDQATMQKYYEGDLFELRKKEIEKISFSGIAEKPKKK